MTKEHIFTSNNFDEKINEIIDINKKIDILKNIKYCNNVKTEFIFNNIDININNINITIKHVFLDECPVCYNNKIMNNKFFSCNHLICNLCYKTWNNKCINEMNNTTCPLCRKI